MEDGRSVLISDQRQHVSKITRNKHTLEHLLPYVQLAMNMVFVSIFFYLCYSILKVIQKDVDMKLEIEVLKHVRKIEQCKRNYEINECNPEMRVRALDSLCEEWLHCIHMEGMQGIDSKFSLRRGVLWAETFGEVINAFVGSIHIRTWFIIIFTIISCMFIANLSFGWLKLNLTNEDKKHT